MHYPGNVLRFIHTRKLHHAPHATDLTECNADFTEGLTACTPAIIDNSQGATVPTTSATSGLAFIRQVLEKSATSSFCAGIPRVVSQVQGIAMSIAWLFAHGQFDLMRRRL
jgi:hypothetical protein